MLYRILIFITITIIANNVSAHTQSSQSQSWADCNTDGHNGTYTCTQRTQNNGTLCMVSSLNSTGGAWDNHNYPCGTDCPISGQVMNSITHVCSAPEIICPSGQYAPTGSTSTSQCIAIPNCNATSPEDGKFFNVTTKQCEVESEVTLCITGPISGSPSQYYCPPIDDCKPASYICINEPSEVSAKEASRASEIAAIKAQSDPKAASAETLAASAQTAAAAKQTDAQAKSAAVVTALSEMESLNNDPIATQQQKDAAAQAYSDAVTDAVNAATKSTNANAAAAAASTASDNAQSHNNQVPTSNPSNADIHYQWVGKYQNDAGIALGDAISGLGAGTGTGSGQSPATGDCQIQGNCTDGLATESTVKGIADSLEQLSGDGSGEGSYSELPETFYESQYPEGIEGIWNDHNAALNQTAMFQAVAVLTPDLGDGGTIPDFSMEVLSFGTFTIPVNPDIWPFLRLIIIITALFTARSIIFGG